MITYESFLLITVEAHHKILAKVKYLFCVWFLFLMINLLKYLLFSIKFLGVLGLVSSLIAAGKCK